MIEIDVRLPLDRFELKVTASIESRAAVVLGPSGSGKTSLLEVIAGLRRRAVGRVVIDGEIVLDSGARTWLAPERRRLGYVPQDAALFPHLDVEANVRFGLKPAAGAEHRFAEAVEMLEIGGLLHRYPATLSWGERQRVALARALATAPRALLLDEPLAALDLALKERILPFLLRIRDEARTRLLYVTHNIGEALALASEGIMLGEGKVEARGPLPAIVDIGRLSKLDPRASFENIVTGTVLAPEDPDGTGRLELPGGAVLLVPRAAEPVGARATYSIAAEDLLIAVHALDGISARNVLRGRVDGIDGLGAEAMLHITAAGWQWRAKLTAGSVAALGLNPGREVWVAMKVSSFRRLAGK